MFKIGTIVKMVNIDNSVFSREIKNGTIAKITGDGYLRVLTGKNKGWQQTFTKHEMVNCLIPMKTILNMPE